jgi:SAM-dependent methyltransferase
MQTPKDPPKPLFDRALVRARRTRGARRDGDAFLTQRVGDDAAERILDINRNFERSLLLGDPAMTAMLCDMVEPKLGQAVRADFINTTDTLDLICDEENLPFSDRSFDFIFSGLRLHAVNNIPKTLMDIKRLLTPDGLFICAFFGGETLRELRHALYEAEDIVTGQVSPRVSPMIDLQQAASLVQKAGFTMPVVDRDLVKVSYQTLDGLYADLRRMSETNALSGRSNIPSSKRLFQTLSEI